VVLNEATLVLNKSWLPIDFTTVRDALTMVYTEAAKAVNPEDYSIHNFSSWTDLRVAEGEDCVHTVSLEIRVPEVIVLTNFNKIPHRRVVLSRRNLFRRDHSSCQYCGIKLKTEDGTIDHVLPRSQGGKTTWTNCVIACVECNRKKANRTPEQAKMPLRYKPKKPRWNPSLKLPVFKRKVSWESFISEAYWTVELAE